MDSLIFLAKLCPSQGTSSQVGSKAITHTPAGESSSQAGNNLPISQAVSQGTRHSARQRALQASQGNSTASQADTASSWEGNHTCNPPIGFPQGLPQKTTSKVGH